jgi:hypothetical protein
MPDPEIPEVPTDILNKEPVLIFLNGIAAVANVILVALQALGVVDFEGDQITALVIAIQSVAALASLVIRSAVVSPATNAIEVKEALLTPPPGTPPEFP